MTQKTLTRRRYNSFYRYWRVGNPDEAFHLAMRHDLIALWVAAGRSYKMRLTTDPLARSLEQRRAYRHWSEAL
jgi:hypothetical protein